VLDLTLLLFNENIIRPKKSFPVPATTLRFNMNSQYYVGGFSRIGIKA